MILDHTQDVAVQYEKLVEATNEVIKLTEQLVVIGTALNDAKVTILKAPGAEEKHQAIIDRQIIEGKFAEVKARIKCQKEIINSLKIILKAEGSHL